MLFLIYYTSFHIIAPTTASILFSIEGLKWEDFEIEAESVYYLEGEPIIIKIHAKENTIIKLYKIINITSSGNNTYYGLSEEYIGNLTLAATEMNAVRGSVSNGTKMSAEPSYRGYFIVTIDWLKSGEYKIQSLSYVWHFYVRPKPEHGYVGKIDKNQ